MRAIWLFIPAVLISTCAAAVTPATGDDPTRKWRAPKPITNTMSLSLRIHDAGEESSVDAIRILDSASGKVLQEIGDVRGFYDAPSKDDQTVIVDANFDGHPDITLLETGGDTHNYTQRFYLFNSRTKQFVLDPFLSKLSAVRVNQNQTLTSSMLVSERELIESHYRYQDGKLTLFSSVKTKELAEGVREKTIGTLNGGKMTYSTIVEDRNKPAK